MSSQRKILFLTSDGVRRYKLSVAPECIPLFEFQDFLTTLINNLQALDPQPEADQCITIKFSDNGNSDIQVIVPDAAPAVPETVHMPSLNVPAPAPAAVELSTLMHELSPFKAIHPVNEDLCSPPRKKLNFSSDDNESRLEDSSGHLDDPHSSSVDVYSSQCIRVVNLLSDDYVEEHFKKKLARLCYIGGINQALEEVVTGSRVDSATKSIVFELTSPAIADWLLQKRSISYDGREVLFFPCDAEETVPESYNLDEDWGDDVIPLGFSKYIQVLNLLNEDYLEEHFKKKLARMCFEERITQTLENVIIGSKEDPTENSIVFELTSPAIVDWLIKKGSMEYDGRDLVFLECDSEMDVCNNNAPMPAPQKSSCRALPAKRSSRSSPSRAASTPNSSPTTAKGTTSVPLNCPEGTTIFLRALLKFKNLFVGNDHSDGEAVVQRELQKQGVEATMDEIKKKRRSLLNQYQKKKKAAEETGKEVMWDLYLPCGVLNRDIPEEELIPTEFDYWEENKPRACLNKIPDYDDLKFRKVAVWPVDCAEELIWMFKKYKFEFDKPQDHSETWYKVARGLYQKNRKMVYSAVQCQNKWDALKATYRGLRDKVDKTGGEGALRITRSWPLYAEMDEILFDDVSVQPVKTVALGSTHETHTSVSEEPTRPLGKTRPSSLTRRSPGSNNDGLLQIAKAMDKRNELIAERNALLAGKK